MTKKKQPKKIKVVEAPPPSKSSWYGPYVWLLAVLLLFGSIRIRLLDFPLERDEGEYAYAGQLILQHLPPYSLVYNMKLPGTYYYYSAILYLFGQTPAAVHLGLLLVNLSTIVLLFLLVKRLFDPTAAVVAAASYGLMSASPSVLGFAGHATHFVVQCAVAGLLLLQIGVEQKRWWLFFTSGLCLGLAFLMKQPGALFLMFGGLFLIKTEWTRPVDWRRLIKHVLAFSVGGILPFACICLILYRAGVFQKFWFWTFSYAREYGGEQKLSEGWDFFSQNFGNLAMATIGIWIIAAVGLTAFYWNPKIRRHAIFVGGLLLFSFAGVSAGLYFRPHYFVLMLPAVAMLAGIGVSSASDKITAMSDPRKLKWMPEAVFAMAFAISIFTAWQFFFEMDMFHACRQVYGLEAFPEALPVAEYIQNHTGANTRIVVFGSEPEVYFYAHRHSATGYIYMYGLTEVQKFASTMQKEAIAEVDAAQPEYVILFKGPMAYWGIRPGTDLSFFNWGMQFLREHYQAVGAVEVLDDRAEYLWENDLEKYDTGTDMSVLIWKRKG